jgi:AraC-like DNA-binding protein
MIEDVYIVSLLALSVALFATGLMFLFLNVCNNRNLTAYRRASKAVAFTYIYFGVINILECVERQNSGGGSGDNALLFRVVTLIIASAQAFSFMFAMVSLINTNYMTPKRTRMEIYPVLAFIAGGLMSYFLFNETVTNVFAYVYTTFYFSQLIRYTLTFRRLYRHCLLEMENYFAGYEETRLRWVSFSFYSALAIGLLALVFTVLPHAVFGLITSLACLVFYVYFAIRFVNYVFIFRMIEDVITVEPEEAVAVAEAAVAAVAVGTSAGFPQTLDSKMAASMKRRLNKWVAEKHYCQPGITIKDLANHLGTNTKYLSRYINDSKGKSFRNWIGALRIEEAQRLLQEDPYGKIDGIAEAIGYANKSAFQLQFAKQTGMTPSEWKKGRMMSDK